VAKHNFSVDPPGYKEVSATMQKPVYGWAVLVPRQIGAHGDQRKFAVIGVRDWRHAMATMPYKWLNEHPRQPASVEDTYELVLETLAKKQKSLSKP
jgi:hypothetical protein